MIYQRIRAGLLALFFFAVAIVFIWSLITEGVGKRKPQTAAVVK